MGDAEICVQDAVIPNKYVGRFDVLVPNALGVDEFKAACQAAEPFRNIVIASRDDLRYLRGVDMNVNGYCVFYGVEIIFESAIRYRMHDNTKGLLVPSRPSCFLIGEFHFDDVMMAQAFDDPDLLQYLRHRMSPRDLQNLSRIDLSIAVVA